MKGEVRVILVSAALLVACCALLCPYGVVAQGGAPSPEMMAAGLRNQEAPCGASMEIDYSSVWTQYEDGTEKARSVTRYHYIRTPGAFKADVTRNTRSGGVRVLNASFDRPGSSYTQLVTQPMPDGKTKSYGVLSNVSSTPFLNYEFLETTHYCLGRLTLEKAVQGGSVSEATESVDGHDCWRVTVPADRASLDAYVVWLDGAIGFSPRKVQFCWKDQVNDVVYFRDYVEISPGAWFPKAMVCEYAGHSPGYTQFTYRVVNTVEKITVGRSVPQSEMRVTLPSGTRVVQDGVESDVP
jgi:hypothetical protein